MLHRTHLALVVAGLVSAVAAAQEELATEVPDPLPFLLDPTLADGFEWPASAPDARAIGQGEVVVSEGDRVVVRHRFFENGAIVTLESSYAPLSTRTVAVGDPVARGAIVGRSRRRVGIQLILPESGPEPLGHAAMRRFFRDHRTLVVPARLDRFLLVEKSVAKARLVMGGAVVSTFEIGLGQAEGRKERQGDLRTPEGAYRITQKLVGPFDATDDPSKEWLGTRFLRLGYPNRFDAARGLAAGLITQSQHAAIVSADLAGTTPPKATRLGGGIGLHGWAEGGWSDDDTRLLTWGCVTFHEDGLQALYEVLDVGDLVIVRP